MERMRKIMFTRIVNCDADGKIRNCWTIPSSRTSQRLHNGRDTNKRGTHSIQRPAVYLPLNLPHNLKPLMKMALWRKEKQFCHCANHGCKQCVCQSGGNQFHNVSAFRVQTFRLKSRGCCSNSFWRTWCDIMLPYKKIPTMRM